MTKSILGNVKRKNKIIFGLISIFMVFGKSSFSAEIFYNTDYFHLGNTFNLNDNYNFKGNTEIIGSNNQYAVKTDKKVTIKIADDKKLKIHSTYKTNSNTTSRNALNISGDHFSHDGGSLNIIGNKADVKISTSRN